MLIRSAVRQEPLKPFSMTPWEYGEMMKEADKQSVSGLLIEALRNNNVTLQKKCVIHMMKLQNAIISNNRLLNRRAVEVSKLFNDAGFRTCVIKGQGNTLFYPNPFSRIPGDIDLWVEGSRKEISTFVKSLTPSAQDGMLHIDFPYFQDVDVEVHYWPSFMNRPKYNKRLRRWYSEHADPEFSHRVSLPETEGDLCISTPEFNVIQQLSHIMSHYFIEGIGLRQFVDYYYVLKNAKRPDGIEALLHDMGMLKFARGVMWVEQQIFHLEDQYLLTSADEKIGKMILDEILQGGNFGWHDTRYHSRNRGLLTRGITDAYRLVKLSSTFPGESLWKIWGKILNQRWKLFS